MACNNEVRWPMHINCVRKYLIIALNIRTLEAEARNRPASFQQTKIAESAANHASHFEAVIKCIGEMVFSADEYHAAETPSSINRNNIYIKETNQQAVMSPRTHH